MPTLFLIPAPLAPGLLAPLPDYLAAETVHVQAYVVEQERTARRFLLQLWKRAGASAAEAEARLQATQLQLLNEHTPEQAIHQLLQPLRLGQDMGLISEAGLPAVADPGAELVQLAHQEGFTVKPLAGPSSIFLALMASGLVGQRFTFHGYLPRDNPQRRQALQRLEKQAGADHSTQLFMETPYRNAALLADSVAVLKPTTLLCIAAALTTPEEYICTLSIQEWQRRGLPSLSKKPAVFALGVGIN